MKGGFVALLRLLVLGLFALCWAQARADTPVSLFQAFRGQVNFVGTEETLRTKANNQPCRLVRAGSGIYAYLGGIPSGAKILSAQLYWAGSGKTPDYSVNFDGVTTTAPSNRRYTSATIGGGYYYFSGAADVTSQVAAKGNGYYTFSGLSVDNGDPWCSAQGVVGGFSLLVVYSSPSEAYRLLNVYEGFQYFRDSGFTLTLDNFAIPNPLPSNATGRVAHITWEGDGTLSGGGEDLLFNGYEMTDSINPSGNQFNSASNVTGDTTSYGIDFDAYTVRYPVIKPGQTTATTTYRSGQDMVLLSAEVAALPYIPLADLALSMTRSGSLQVGSTATYTLSVTNNGADTEMGPVTVVDTLPAGLTLSSAKGSGWTCSSKIDGSSQTIVTCTASGPVLSGATMNPLSLTVSPTKAGNYTNSATVTGQTGDTNQGNNTASNSGSATDPTAGTTGTLVFTTKPCAVGDIVGANCPLFTGPIVAADASARIYVTNVASSVSGDGTPVLKAAAMATQDTSLSGQIALSCAPSSKVRASYAGLTLGCDGIKLALLLTFKANTPSAVMSDAQATFSYADVGLLTLTLDYLSNNPHAPATTPGFVSQPASIVIYKVVRADGYPDWNDPNGTLPRGLSYPPNIAFTKAGDNFTVQLAAKMANGVYAPSFGMESSKPPVTVTVIDPSSPPLNDGSPGKDWSLSLTNVDNFQVPNSDALNKVGLLTGTLRWNEAGMLTLEMSVDNYLGTQPAGTADGAPGYLIGTRSIGRFYPDHFTTEVHSFDCLPAMNCPVRDDAKPVYGFNSAAYANQPIHFDIVALGLQGTTLQRYVPPQPLTVNAVSLPNSDQLLTNGSFPQVVVPASPQSDGVTYKLLGQATYQLPNPYVTPGFGATQPPAANWGAPQAVYLRASTQDTRYKKDASGADVPDTITISSQISPTPEVPMPPQQEDGLMLVNGRLLVGNVFGSELAQVPLPVSAQYWTGSSWQVNTSDGDSVVGTGLVLGHCTRAFASSCGSTPAPLAIVGVSAAPTGGGPGLQLTKGSGRLTLQAPKRGLSGSIDLQVTGPATPWLPSSTARASFGLFKSPLIYLREVY